ncbi:MAG: isoleucine--tRNA ligase [Ruminococcaceae bacterium]|nr:isoleucine--tRNA ligase [Oscillospiraceae bacterium]
MYQKVTTDMGFVSREQDVLQFWSQQKIFQKSIEHRCGCPEFTFYDGPPTANGKPHIGHILTRVIKDIIPRYQTMKGKHVLRKAGWDTHGLPVELEVEKMLGIDGKQQIEAYGVEPFIDKCRESVWKYKGEWEQISDRVGFWADMDNPYITYENDYIESEWWALRTIWDKGLLYKGHKIVPYCPRCGTALSSHEVAQGYQDVKETSVYVRFPVKGEADTYLAAWTTTPWTLPSNVALCVNPDEEYVLAEFDQDLDGSARNVRYYMAGVMVPQLFSQPFRVIRRLRGRDLVDLEYRPLFPYAERRVAESGKKAFFVTADSYVTLSDGTGIVHIAPAFGEDDARVGRAHDLPFIQLVREDGTLPEDVTDFAGQFCKDADAGLTEKLKRDGLLIKTMPYEHSYPFCWRCDTALIYYARDSWFVRMTAVRDQLLKNNATVNWIPETIRDGRFGNFLENVIDWGISRERYWGTPLPIWECACGHRHLVGSIAELRERSTDCPEHIELHKPYIDQVHLTCPACGGQMTRVPEVIDCWFDSGSMPFAQWHYPFENKEQFEKNFPADFISEALDQTRGWFYTLMALGTVLFDASPYRNVIVLGLVQDKNGQKMSKHKGNVVDPWSVLNEQGADAVRWYFYTASSPWLPSRFSPEAVNEAQRKFMGTLWNTYAFYIMYARIDSFNPTLYQLEQEKLGELDRWILSRMHSLVRQVDHGLAHYDITTPARAIQNFTEDLSNWYVRRSRDRFWQPGMGQDKVNAYMTLYTVLETLTRLSAPFIPFMTETIYRNLVLSHQPDAPESVHLCDFPTADEHLVNVGLEEDMAEVLRLVTMGRAARNTAAIKNRQPLAELYCVSPRRLNERYQALIADELNVRRFSYLESAADLVDYAFKPQLRTLGRRFGKLLPRLSALLAGLDGRSAMKTLREQGKISLDLDGTLAELSEEDLLIETIQPEGLASEQDRDVTVALDVRLTDDLIEEGFVREVISKVQTMRKESDFNITDRIVLRYSGNERIAAIINRNSGRIAEEVLAARIEQGSGPHARDWKLNGEACTLSVEQITPGREQP